jgi:hypothetical protein
LAKTFAGITTRHNGAGLYGRANTAPIQISFEGDGMIDKRIVERLSSASFHTFAAELQALCRKHRVQLEARDWPDTCIRVVLSETPGVDELYLINGDLE